MPAPEPIPLRLLVVDDHQEEASLYSWYLSRLKKYKFEVDYAENGKLGIEKVATCQYDLVFLDYQMPVMNGLGFLTEAGKKGFRVPVVLMTGMGDDKVAAEAIKLGAIDYLRKRDLPKQDFGKLVEKALAAKKATEDAHERMELERLRDQLIVDLSGELQNLLRSVHTFQAAAAAGQPVPPGSESLKTLQETALHMEGLIEDLNNLRSVFYPMALEAKPTKLKALVDAGVAKKKPLLDAVGISFTLSIPHKDVQVKADPACVKVVIENMISNAVHLTPNGGSITLNAHRFSSGMARVGVRNERKGLGIGAFARMLGVGKPVAVSQANDANGLGLGLRLCRKLIEGQGGRLWAETDPQGTTTYITLPAVAKH